MSRCVGCSSDVPAIAFTMAFQPIVDLAQDRIYAFEALVRGPNGEGAGHVLDRVDDANRYRFDQDCRVKAISLAARLGLPQTGASLSINFLPNAVYNPRACIRATLAAARSTRFPLDRLVFEVTENERLAEPAHLTRIVDEYKKLGFRVAIDDFGAGHSGLGFLNAFHPDAVKIDMQLVRGIDTNRIGQAILSGIVAICRDIDITIVAEGVETIAESRMLRSMGIDIQQGFLFARPGFETLPSVTIPVELSRAA